MQASYKKYILEFEKEYDKLIICGHSAGCVLALRLGYYLSTINKPLFFEKCLVIGSAPFCWLPKEKTKAFNNLPNIIVFLNGTKTIYNGEIDYRVDPILSNIIYLNDYPDYPNIKTYKQYYPIHIIYDTDIYTDTDTDIDTDTDTDIDRDTDTDIDRDKDIINIVTISKKKEVSPFRYMEHDWDSYYNKILKYLKVIR